MAYSKITDDMNIIQALPDEPNDVGGLTAAQLKAKFDEAGNKIKTAFNNLVDELNDDSSGASASEIGFTRSAGVPADNVQDAIENVQSQLQGISQGAVADGSITTAKLADGAVTAEKLASGGLGWRKLTESEFGFTAEDAAVKTVEAVDAYFCAALGLVRFQAKFTVSARSANVAIFDFIVDATKHYLPDTGDFNISGVANANCYSSVTDAKILSGVAVRVYVSGDVSEDSLITVSGFYYTEDIPTETEGS